MLSSSPLSRKSCSVLAGPNKVPSSTFSLCSDRKPLRFRLLKDFLDRLSFTQKQVLAMPSVGGCKGLHFFESRIVNHQMIVRAQCWTVMPSNDRLDDHRQFKFPGKLHYTTVCARLDIRWRQEHQRTEMLRCRLEHVRYRTPSLCVTEVGNLRCPMRPA